MSGSNSRTFRTVAIDDVRPYEANPLIHPRKLGRKLEAIVRRHGQVPILPVDNEMTIIGGQEWLSALKAAGITEVKVEILADLTPAEANTLRLALGRLPLDARVDPGRLRSELAALLAQGVELELTAFDQPEIDFALELDMPSANVVEDIDAIPRLQPVISTRGDIFHLDRHRVGCGDICDQAFIDLLREGRLADVCITDPPTSLKSSSFGVGKRGFRHGNFLEAAAELSDLQLYAFLERTLSVLRSASHPSALMYLFINWRRVLELTAAGKCLGMPLLDVAVWTKPSGRSGGLYRSAHELCVIFKVGAEPHHKNVELRKFGRSRTNVWTYAPPASGDGPVGSHRSAKPVAMLSDILRDTTKRGDLIVDGFLGTGAALIAAHETGRTCVGVELDPHHLDVAIRRWQAVTGLDAFHAESGLRFDDMAQRSLPYREARHDL